VLARLLAQAVPPSPVLPCTRRRRHLATLLPPDVLRPPAPPVPLLPSYAFGFRGNITRKWWLACECRYHFLARYQPALPVITAPPGLRHGLLDKPPTAKVYCLFHLPSPSIRVSSSCRVSYPVLFYRALLQRFSIPDCLLSLRLRSALVLPLSPVTLSLSLSLSIAWKITPSPCRQQPLPTLRDV